MESEPVVKNIYIWRKKCWSQYFQQLVFNICCKIVLNFQVIVNGIMDPFAAGTKKLLLEMYQKMVIKQYFEKYFTDNCSLKFEKCLLIFFKSLWDLWIMIEVARSSAIVNTLDVHVLKKTFSLLIKWLKGVSTL